MQGISGLFQRINTGSSKAQIYGEERREFEKTYLLCKENSLTMLTCTHKPDCYGNSVSTQLSRLDIQLSGEPSAICVGNLATLIHKRRSA